MVGLGDVDENIAAEHIFGGGTAAAAADSAVAKYAAVEIVVMDSAVAAGSWHSCSHRIAEAVDTVVLAGTVGFADVVVPADTEGTGMVQPYLGADDEDPSCHYPVIYSNTECKLSTNNEIPKAIS